MSEQFTTKRENQNRPPEFNAWLEVARFTESEEAKRLLYATPDDVSADDEKFRRELIEKINQILNRITPSYSTRALTGEEKFLYETLTNVMFKIIDAEIVRNEQ